MKANIPAKILLCFIFLSISIKNKAQTFHAIILADTQDPQIGITVEKDLSSMSKRLDSIATKIGYQMHLVVMSNQNFNSKALAEKLSSFINEYNP